MIKNQAIRTFKYTMSKSNTLKRHETNEYLVNDTLTDFLRESAQKMLKTAIEQEVNDFIQQHTNKKLDNGQQQVVRNGYLPERNIQTGIGHINIKVPRVRNRGDDDIQFDTSLVPKYMRRTATLDTLLPLLYLKGISGNNFATGLAPMFGEKAKNMSPNVIAGLKQAWHKDYQQWQQRDLSQHEYVYFWVDGVYVQARNEGEKICLLVIVGTDIHGNKRLVGLADGYRESKESWRELLLDLKSRGLSTAPQLAIGDGALGFWGALEEVYPSAKRQRCWVHKIKNVLNKLPKSQQSRAKGILHEIYLSATRKEALRAWKRFVKAYCSKYPKATDCLVKDQDQLLAFYDFPAEHWHHLRTTNPIESTFSTVKHRTRQSRNSCSIKTLVSSSFKLLLEAEKRWRRLRGKERLLEVVRLERFIDGINEKEIDHKLGQIEHAA